MTTAPLRFSPAVEEVKADEQETVEGLKATFDTIQQTTSHDYGHAVRAVHAKAHAVLEGTFTVKAGLPPELAQGLFASPGEHRAYVRMSTNAGDILPDMIGLPRGLALKVLGVDGARLPGAEGDTQDFVMVNGPVFQTRSTATFLANLKLLAKTTDRIEGVKKAASAVLGGLNTALTAVGIESSTVQSLGGAPNVDPLGQTYYSVTAFRYGDHIAKFSLVPTAPQLVAREESRIDAHDRPDAIRETVQAEMRAVDGEWEFRVQLCRDLDRQPVEDPTKEWKADEAPFQTVATLKVPAQDSWSPERVQAVDEAMAFSVWTGLAAHQPLGQINRSRRETYARASAFRARVNGCPIHEPAD